MEDFSRILGDYFLREDFAVELVALMDFVVLAADLVAFAVLMDLAALAVFAALAADFMDLDMDLLAARVAVAGVMVKLRKRRREK